MAYNPGDLLADRTLQLNDVILGQVDANGVCWYWETISGWDSPDLVGDPTPRIGDHGAWDNPAWYAARAVTFSGWLIAPNEAQRDAALTRLRLAAPPQGLVPLTVQEVPPKTAQVRRSGRLQIENLNPLSSYFTVGLIAPDPRRYSTVQSTFTLGLPTSSSGLTLPLTLPATFPAAPATGMGVAVNLGDIAAPWTARLNGPLTNPVLTHIQSGRRLSYAITIAAGDYLLLNSLDHTVLLNGSADRSGYIAVGSSWWRLNNGTNNVKFTADAGTGTCVLTYASTWS
jgi:hypothetical protein